MSLPQDRVYTIKNVYALPDGQRAELIDGRMYMMAPPSTNHQRISYAIARKISDYIDKKNGECEVFLAPFAVFLNQDEQNYVEPDISVICDKSKPVQFISYSTSANMIHLNDFSRIFLDNFFHKFSAVI